MAVDLVVCVATEAEGALIRNHVAVLRTGIGAVNAAHAITRFLEREGASEIIVCGVGGAYPAAGLSVGDVVSAESECYGDLGADLPDGFLDMQALGFPIIDDPSPLYNVLPMHLFPTSRRARFVTVNTCTGRNDVMRRIEARTGGGVESMEGAAIAHVAHLRGIPVGEVRGISNLVGNRDRASWKLDQAACAAQEALLEWLATR